jgi:hypothetical protein
MAALLSLIAFHITFRVAEPEGLARRLPPLANGVTDQGLGGRSEATGAGNPVLCAVGILQHSCTVRVLERNPQSPDIRKQLLVSTATSGLQKFYKSTGVSTLRI